MPRSGGVLHENQPFASALCSVVELALRRRDARGVLEAVLSSEHAHVNRRPLHLGEKRLARFTVRRRQIFEKEDFEVLTEKLVAADVIAKHLPLGRKLLLHAADEDALLHAEAFPTISVSNPSVSFSSARMSARISSSVRIGCGLLKERVELISWPVPALG